MFRRPNDGFFDDQTNPVVNSATFLDKKFFGNLQGMLKMVKWNSTFFVLFLEEIWIKIFTFKDFLDFFNGGHFSMFKVDQIL